MALQLLFQASTCEFLRMALSVQNVCIVYDVASLYCLSNLAQACCTFMDRQAPEVLAADGFHALSKVTGRGRGIWTH